MDKAHSQQLMAYDRWANRRIYTSLVPIPNLSSDQQPARLFSHILAAEEVWLARIQQRPYQDQTFWPLWDPDTWTERQHVIFESWRQFLESPDASLDHVFSYTNSKGVPFKTRLLDAITHLVIHGQHHRAQIAVHLRQMGYEPPATDFIYFTRDDAAT